jgi:phage internal scaffolding protein
MVNVPFIRSPYNYDRDAASVESGLLCLDPSLTKQEFTEECDVNFILDRFVKGGDLTLNARTPRYGDFTSMPGSYHEALIFIKDTERSFMELDAKIRAKFDNDPQKFLDFVSDPANADQLVDMGLANAIPPSNEPATHGSDFEGGSTPEGGKPPKKPVSKASKGDKGEGDSPEHI